MFSLHISYEPRDIVFCALYVAHLFSKFNTIEYTSLRCNSLFVSWMWLIAKLFSIVLVLHCNAMLSWVVVMVKSRDLRLVWEVHKPDLSQRTDVTSKALNLCTEKKKHLLMQLNEHFKNVSMSQSHYLKHKKKKNIKGFGLLFPPKAFILTL